MSKNFFLHKAVDAIVTLKHPGHMLEGNEALHGSAASTSGTLPSASLLATPPGWVRKAWLL